MTTDSLSRQFARWAVETTYDDLPPEVIEKLRSLLLLHLVAGLHGLSDEHGRLLVEQVEAEESRPGGATIFGRPTTATRSGAVLANCELFHCAGLYDSYRMLTHPGPVLVAVALTNAELGGKDLREVITALAVGYEFECRLAAEAIPTVSARGFRPAPLFSTMGAVLVAGKLVDLDEDAMVSAIAVAANCAAGLNESGRGSGNERLLHESMAARQGTLAAMTASLDFIHGSEEILEGDAGFFNAFTGSADGRLTHVVEGPLRTDYAELTAGLGSDYLLLQVMYRIYAFAGYNQAPVELIRQLRQRHGFAPGDVRSVTVELNYLETLYPSPAFPRFPDVSAPRKGSTPYYVAQVLLNGDHPVVGQPALGTASVQEVVDYSERITLVGVHDQPLFSPRIRVETVDGEVYAGSLAYAEMMWSFDELADRLRAGAAGLPGGTATLDAVVDLLRTVEKLDSVQPVFDLPVAAAARAADARP